MNEMFGSKRNRIGSVFGGKVCYGFDLELERNDIIVRKFALQSEPTQGILLPGRSGAGPVKQLVVHHDRFLKKSYTIAMSNQIR